MEFKQEYLCTPCIPYKQLEIYNPINNPRIYNNTTDIHMYTVLKCYICPHCNLEYRIVFVIGLQYIKVIPHEKCSLGYILRSSDKYDKVIYKLKDFIEWLNNYYNSNDYMTDLKINIVKEL